MKFSFQKIFLPQTIFIGLLIILITNSCRKIDSLSVSDYATTSRFFQAKGNTKPVVKRIIEKIKSDNERHPFVASMAQNSGFAVWDKAIIQAKPNTPAKGFQNRDMSGDDTIVLIPLVLDNTEYVNSFFAVKVTDNILLKLFSGKDYDKYPFGTDWETTMTADRVAAEIMNLEKETFGHDYFKITDSRLFLKPGEVRDGTESVYATFERSQVQEGIFGCQLIGISVNGDNADLTLYCGGSWSGGAPPYGWDDGGGGGGGQNNNNGNNGNNGTGSSSGSNSGTGTGLGWGAVKERNCDSNIANFLNDTAFVSHFKYLNTPAVTGLNYEKGFLVTDTGNYNLQVGMANSPTIPWDIQGGTKVIGLLHSHSSGLNSIFSPQDVIFMAEIFLKHFAKDPANLYFGVTSDYGSPYFIKVSDPIKFYYFADSIAGNPKKMENFSSKYDTKFNSTDPDKNEKEFLKMLNEYKVGEGLKLYRANENISELKRLTIDGFGDIRVTDCPAN